MELALHTGTDLLDKFPSRWCLITKDDSMDTWEDCLEKHGPALVLFARRWTNCHSEAEDIVQDAFVRSWQQRKNVRDIAPYLFTCVRTVALNRLRETQRRKSREQSAVADMETCFENPLENRQRQELIETALQTLSPEQQEVIVLKIWGDLTFQAIGQVLAIPPDTAASRYRYAMAALRRVVDKEAVQ